MNPDYSNNMQNLDMYRDYYDLNDRTYPEIYNKISPYISKAMENLGDYSNLADEDINMLTDKIIAESNIMANPPGHHNRETIFDFVKLLLLKELDDMGDYAVATIGPFEYYPYPYSYPYNDDYWWFPFVFGDGFAHRGFGRRRYSGYRRQP